MLGILVNIGETSELAANVAEPHLTHERASIDAASWSAAERLTSLAARLLGAAGAGLTRAGPGGQFLIAHQHLPGPWALAGRMPPGCLLGEAVVGRQEPLVIEDLPAHPDFAQARETIELRFRSYLGLPLLAPDETALGCLFVFDLLPRRWTADDQVLLAELASLAAAQLMLQDRLGEEARQRARMTTAMRRIDDPLFALDRDWRFSYVNTAAARLLGRPAADLRGTRVWNLFPEVLDSTFYRQARRIMAGGAPVCFESYCPPLESWFAVTAYPTPDGMTVYAQDITSRKLDSEALRQSEQRYRNLVQNALDVIAVLNVAATFTYIGPSVQRILGYQPDDLLETCLFDLVHQGDLGSIRDAFQEIVATPKSSLPLEFRVRHRDGTWRYVEAIGTHSLDVPGIDGIIVNARDVTEHKRVEEQLAYQAFHDPLTNLPNRTLFTDRLSHALAWATRRSESVAVLFMDLDRFKLINDTLGHDTGDQLLIAVGQRIQACLRSGDTVTRLGGDEFTVLLEGLINRDTAIDVAHRIIDAIESPFQLGRHEVLTTASIGMAFGDDRHQQPEDLLRDADAALYQAKAHGRARLEVFAPSMQVEAHERRVLADDLRHAMSRGEFYLDYQPIVELATGRIVSVESLVRWSHPRRGVILPGEFLPMADEIGLASPLLRWVLESACGQAVAWQQLFLPGEAPAMTVNLSARQLRQPGVVDLVASVLAETGLHPSKLRLEITANAMMDDRESDDGTLLALAGLGVRLAIDDFSIGSSSLGTLKHLPVDVLIVDQSFVASLERDGENVSIVRAIVMLARTLELGVIAQRIETASDLRQARALGCDLGQGYYISRPIAADALSCLLSDGYVPLTG